MEVSLFQMFLWWAYRESGDPWCSCLWFLHALIYVQCLICKSEGSGHGRDAVLSGQAERKKSQGTQQKPTGPGADRSKLKN